MKVLKPYIKFNLYRWKSFVVLFGAEYSVGCEYKKRMEEFHFHITVLNVDIGFAFVWGDKTYGYKKN